MNIRLISVGRLKESYWTSAVKEYSKRLQRYHQLKIIEIADEKDCSSLASTAQMLNKEGARILSHLSAKDYVIALAIEGRTFDSIQWTKHLQSLADQGKHELTFLIGGSHGLSAEVMKRANEHHSFSKMTFPHQLMRIVFLEQLYRSTRISRGEPYHK